MGKHDFEGKRHISQYILFMFNQLPAWWKRTANFTNVQAVLKRKCYKRIIEIIKNLYISYICYQQCKQVPIIYIWLFIKTRNHILQLLVTFPKKESNVQQNRSASIHFSSFAPTFSFFYLFYVANLFVANFFVANFYVANFYVLDWYTQPPRSWKV